MSAFSPVTYREAVEEVAEILGDIKRDDKRASDIIARIRSLLRNHLHDAVANQTKRCTEGHAPRTVIPNFGEGGGLFRKPCRQKHQAVTTRIACTTKTRLR